MSVIDDREEGVEMETQLVEENLLMEPEASLLLLGCGGATFGLGNAQSVELRSEKAEPFGVTKVKEFGICVRKEVK